MLRSAELELNVVGSASTSTFVITQPLLARSLALPVPARAFAQVGAESGQVSSEFAAMAMFPRVCVWKRWAKARSAAEAVPGSAPRPASKNAAAIAQRRGTDMVLAYRRPWGALDRTLV